jgi:hypothetical protein
VGWSEVCGRVRLAFVLLAVAACTDPTFPDETDEGGVSAVTDRDSGPASTLDADAAPGFGAQGTGEHDAAPIGGSERDAAPGDARGPELTDGAVGADGGEQSDAGAGSPSGSIPSWARPLLGRYLKRSITTGYDDLISMVTASVELSLATISANAQGELEMLIEVCSVSTQWLNNSAKLGLDDVSAIPTVKLRILLGEPPHFSSETAFQAIGFDPARAALCEGGAARVERFPEQTWILGTTCTCAATPELLPLTSSDCRLNDPDGDGRPGVTFAGTGLAGDSALAMSLSLKITDGEVRADREHIFQERRVTNASCVYSLVDSCDLGNNTQCPVVLTHVLPLDAAATCATVLAQAIPVPVLSNADCRGPNP